MRVATSSFKLKLTDVGYSPGEYMLCEAWGLLGWSLLVFEMSSLVLLGVLFVLFVPSAWAELRRVRVWRDAPEIKVEFIEKKVTA